MAASKAGAASPSPARLWRFRRAGYRGADKQANPSAPESCGYSRPSPDSRGTPMNQRWPVAHRDYGHAWDRSRRVGWTAATDEQIRRHLLWIR